MTSIVIQEVFMTGAKATVQSPLVLDETESPGESSMQTRLKNLCCALGLLAALPSISVCAQTPENTSSAATVFLKADQDSDMSLSKAEYQTLRGESKEVVRDWIVFDLNADQLLSETEFLAIPSVGGVSRGSIPDPFAAMIDRLLDVVKK